jgi:hypothetical protein
VFVFKFQLDWVGVVDGCNEFVGFLLVVAPFVG